MHRLLIAGIILITCALDGQESAARRGSVDVVVFHIATQKIEPCERITKFQSSTHDLSAPALHPVFRHVTS